MLESLFLLLPVSILFVLLIGGALWWAIFSGQFDDLNSAGKSILLDDDSVSEEDDPNSEINKPALKESKIKTSDGVQSEQHRRSHENTKAVESKHPVSK